MDADPSQSRDPWDPWRQGAGTAMSEPAASASAPKSSLSDLEPGPGKSSTDDRTAGDAVRPGGISRRWRWVIEWAVVLVIALAVALCVRAFVIQTFYIPSASMEPTLMIGDRIIVDKLSYDLHAVHRGDIIVFNRPPGEPKSANIQDLVKRVVGLPGETIWSSDGNVYVQGPDTADKVVLVPEPVAGTQLGPVIRRQTVPPDDYYVLGDNRTNSDDSRYFGYVPRSDIVGRVVMRIWPVSSIRFY